MSNPNVEAQKTVARKIIRKALEKGYSVSVGDGVEFSVKRSRSFAELSGALATTEENHLVMRNPDATYVGTVYLVWDGMNDQAEEVVNDYSDNAEIAALVD